MFDEVVTNAVITRDNLVPSSKLKAFRAVINVNLCWVLEVSQFHNCTFSNECISTTLAPRSEEAAHAENANKGYALYCKGGYWRRPCIFVADNN